MYYKHTKFKHRLSQFLTKSKFLIFFLCELPLILGVEEKLKKTAQDIYTRTLYIEFERDRSIGLGSTLGDGLKIKTIFSSFRDFSGGNR